jgi:hypothetical protein
MKLRFARTVLAQILNRGLQLDGASPAISVADVMLVYFGLDQQERMLDCVYQYANLPMRAH